MAAEERQWRCPICNALNWVSHPKCWSCVRQRHARRADAAEWLTKYLADHGPTSVDDLAVECCREGITEAEFGRACQDMKIVIDLPPSVRELLKV
jgi:hypothetical protein